MVTAVRSLGLQGISGYEVTVECFLSGGLPAFDIVGLGDTAVKESRERVRAAVKNCGVKFPVSRITVNLAPAGRKKEGTLYDLPILLGILACAEEIKPPAKDAAFVGELSLTGTLRAVNGVLPMAMAAVRAGIRTLYVPAANAAEATLADGVTVYGVPDVVSLVQHLKGEKKLSPQPKWQAEQTSETGPDFSDVMGQENVKRALEIAAAGGHNILLIVSPVSSYMIAKRGVKLEMVHFFSPPYTSDAAKEKVLSLAKLLVPWCGRMTVQVVPFTEIQEEIRRNCPEEFFTLIMRRFMMRISQRVADQVKAKALVTGENLGQVASQTMEALRVTEDVVDLPVLRPLIGMDKEEIVRLSRKIGTFDTSILPYEDCCTVFTPRHPRTKPNLEEVREAEAALDIEGLIDRAMANREFVRIKF